MIRKSAVDAPRVTSGFTSAVAPILAALVAVFMFWSCAGQVAPSGGPPDKTPPEVLATVPSSGSLRFHESHVKIAFDKYMNHLRVEQAIFISPNAGQLSFDWGGTDLDIQLPDSLRPQTTYILTIGTDAEDTHGNKLSQTFALPFSTGDRIDSASVSGRIFDPTPTGVMVFAYRLDQRLADTLNPAHTKPDFLTQSGKDGNFRLTNLAPGNYRLVAVRDEFKDLLYDVQSDHYGVLTEDIALPAETSAVQGVQFRLTATDTAAPFLSSARPVNRRAILLKFSKQIDPRTIDETHIAIHDTLQGTSLPVSAMMIGESGLEAYAVTAVQESARGYRVDLTGLRDLFGNGMAPAAGGAFEGTSRADTGQMTVRFLGGGDTLRNVDPQDTLWITFSKPVERRAFEHAVTLEDSARRRISVSIGWANAFRAYLQSPDLAFGAKYVVKFVLDSVYVYGEKPFKDSVLVRHFTVIGEDQFGSMKGTIIDQSRGVRGPYILQMTDVQKKGMAPRELRVDSAGGFTWSHLREGKYLLWGFVDANRDSLYSYGRIFPYKTSERFAVYPDTLKIRVRWPLEGVGLKFP